MNASCISIGGWIRGALLLAFLCLHNHDAQASAPDAEVPYGVPLGEILGTENTLSSFYVQPSIRASSEHRDNLFLTEQTPRGDWVHTAAPALAFTSDWDNHRVYAEAGLKAVRHADFTREDHDDWHVDSGALLRIREETALRLKLGARQEREERIAPESNPANLPMARYDRYDSGIQFIHASGIIEVQLAGDVRRWRFDNSYFKDNGERSRDDAIATARVRMGLGEEWGIFLAPRFEKQDYLRATDSSGVNRDADITGLLAGLSYRVTDLTQLEAGAGYSRFDPADPQLKRGHIIAFDISLVWSPLDILQLDAAFARKLDTTILPGVSGITVTEGNLAARYAYSEETTLHAGMEMRQRDFTGTTRQDDDTALEAGISYAVADNITLDMRWKKQQRDSNAALRSFADNSFRVGVTVGV